MNTYWNDVSGDSCLLPTLCINSKLIKKESVKKESCFCDRRIPIKNIFRNNTTEYKTFFNLEAKDIVVWTFRTDMLGSPWFRYKFLSFTPFLTFCLLSPLDLKHEEEMSECQYHLEFTRIEAQSTFITLWLDRWERPFCCIFRGYGDFYFFLYVRLWISPKG